ncbi:I78 family peptidase inhibitor [Lysobacter xanthus]
MNRPVRIATLLASATLDVALAACATPSGAPPMSDPHPPAAAQQCRPEAAQSLVGQPATPQNVETARMRAGAEVARVLKPGQMVTMEFRDGRLNVYVDAANLITRIACG